MLSTILSGAFCGIDSYLVQVEVDVSPGLPCMEMIGALSREAGEARERIRVALKNNGIRFPASRITINLSPADRHKSGTAFDLPAAVGLLMAIGELPESAGRGILFLGELGLSGELKPVKGVLPIVRQAALSGIRICIVPAGNGQEAAVIHEMKVYGAEHISQVILGLKNRKGEEHEPVGLKSIAPDEGCVDLKGEKFDFSDICGQEAAKRALEIAAAGFHHILLIGPPGSGKTMLARRIPTIMPLLSLEESLETSAIYSVAGRLEGGRICKERPFLNPHHSSTGAAMIGGGRVPIPGAVSFAHRGVLFLDELTEFKKSVLEVLRQPLEEHRVQLMRNYGAITYPADFLLVAAMNPCPCGYYPQPEKCTCKSAEVRRYLNHVSGPILDRIDLQIEVPVIDVKKLTCGQRPESSEQMRMRVMHARERQLVRFKGTKLRFNGEMGVQAVRDFCVLTPAVEKHLHRSFEMMHLSVRAYHKIIKTARTIADLAGEERISETHINEAVYYRTAVRKYWEKGLE